jgi:hypothetical protein
VGERARAGERLGTRRALRACGVRRRRRHVGERVLQRLPALADVAPDRPEAP